MGAAINTPNRVYGDEESFRSIFDTVAEQQKVRDIAHSSLMFSCEEGKDLKFFFNSIMRDNRSRLSQFTGEKLAQVVYVNYRSRTMQELKKEESYLNTLKKLKESFPEEKLRQIFPENFQVDDLVERSLDRFLTRHLTVSCSSTTEYALRDLLGIKDLRFYPPEKLPQLDATNCITITEEHLDVLREKSQNE